MTLLLWLFEQLTEALLSQDLGSSTTVHRIGPFGSKRTTKKVVQLLFLVSRDSSEFDL